MESFANGDGQVEGAGTTLYLSRTGPGVSTISKERPHWLIQKCQHTKWEQGIFYEHTNKL